MSDVMGCDDGRWSSGQLGRRGRPSPGTARAENLKSPSGDSSGPTKGRKPFSHQINKVPTVCPASSKPPDTPWGTGRLSLHTRGVSHASEGTQVIDTNRGQGKEGSSVVNKETGRGYGLGVGGTGEMRKNLGVLDQNEK